jgi:ATP-dependent DNA helicase RecQ
MGSPPHAPLPAPRQTPRPTPLEVHQVLKNVFGYDSFRLRQEEIILRVIGGGDALVIMPTGGGKSLCYQLPALIRPGVAVVVSPLISLMQDQVDALLQLGVRAASLNSSLSPPRQRAVERRLSSGELDLVYVAPERLMTPGFLELIGKLEIALIAIDEAHCISQWGHDFRPEYLQLADVRELFPGIPTIAVTATADGPTQKDILRRLRFSGPDLFVTGFDRPNLRFAVELKRSAKQQLWQFLQREHANDAGIVYCLSRKRVEEFAGWLNDRGRKAVPYHAGLSAAEREKNQERFIREEGLIVVATVAFGMGIDKPNVRFVAHVDVPKNPEGYYQEVGRAGRDGLPANAWMLYSLADVVMLRQLMNGSEADEQHKMSLQHKLNAIVGYCETAACRRQVILNYFGEAFEGPCRNCDNCLNPVETWDGTVDAQKVLSCVYRTGQRFGAGHIVDVILGKESEKIHRFRHDRLSTFGVGADRSANEWRSVIRQLVASDLLRVDVEGYGGLKLTKACGPVLKGQRKVQLRRDAAPPKKEKKRSRAPAADGPPATPFEQALFERLRELRLQLARTQDVPPYVIFHDSTLLAMARHRPETLAAIGTLPGVGAVKLERYGEAFLEAIQDAAISSPAPPPEV